MKFHEKFNINKFLSLKENVFKNDIQHKFAVLTVMEKHKFTVLAVTEMNKKKQTL